MSAGCPTGSPCKASGAWRTGVRQIVRSPLSKEASLKSRTVVSLAEGFDKSIRFAGRTV